MNWLMSLAGFFSRLLPASVTHRIYKSPRLSKFVRQELNRFAPVGIRPVVVTAGELKGYSLLLDLQSEKDYWLGLYEVDLQKSLHELVKPGTITYDVGANIGYISLILARLVGEDGKVFAFEALPANIERWHANMNLNKMTERMHLFNGAVSDHSGQVRFLVHKSGGMGKAIGSAGRDNTYKDEIEVPGISLDDYVFSMGNPPPQLIKMDIEGGEVLALPGMQRLLKAYRPILLMEIHGYESSQAAWKTLIEHHYRICWMKPGFPPVAALETLDWKAYLAAFPESE